MGRIAPGSGGGDGRHDNAFEAELGLRFVDRHRVVPRVAGVAVALLAALVLGLDRPHHPLQREEGQRVGADEVAHLVHGVSCRHQVAVVAHVDAEVTRG